MAEIRKMQLGHQQQNAKIFGTGSYFFVYYAPSVHNIHQTRCNNYKSRWYWLHVSAV